MTQTDTSQMSPIVASDSVPSSRMAVAAGATPRAAGRTTPKRPWLRWATPVMVAVAFVAGIAATVQVLGLMVAANSATSVETVLRVQERPDAAPKPEAAVSVDDNVMVVIGRKPARATAGSVLINKLAG